VVLVSPSRVTEIALFLRPLQRWFCRIGLLKHKGL